MTFKILLIEVYAVLQLYLLSVRNTVTWRSLTLMGLLGGFAGAAVVIVAQLVLFRYWQAPAQAFGFAAAEEVIKIGILVAVLSGAGVWKSLGILDVMLYGAAVGAGFAVAEATIYAMENAAVPPNVAAYTGVESILLSWVPAKWVSGETAFAGHAASTALAGLGIGWARRLPLAAALRWAAALLVAAIPVFMHIWYNRPPDAENHAVQAFLFTTLGRSGRALSLLLFAGLLGAMAYESKMVWRAISADAGRPLPRPILMTLSEMVAALGQGWRNLLAYRTEARRRFEVENLAWSAAATEVPPNPAPASIPLAARLVPRGLLGYVRLVVVVVVVAFGLWALFVSPFMTHSRVQTLVRGKPAFYLGIIAQIVVMAAFITALRRRDWFDRPGDAAFRIGERARYALAWTAAGICLFVWKRYYDQSLLPYPFRPAQIVTNWWQFVSCMGASAVPPLVGGMTAPLVPLFTPPRPAEAPVARKLGPLSPGRPADSEEPPIDPEAIYAAEVGDAPARPRPGPVVDGELGAGPDAPPPRLVRPPENP